MEELMYYVWRNRMFSSLIMLDDTPIEIIDPGLRNLNEGPDFFNAKVKIDGTLWAGNVEMHVNASDWYKHNHQNNPAYDNVILHVVMAADTDIRLHDGTTLKTVVMKIPSSVLDKYNDLTRPADSAISCAPRLSLVPDITLHDWIYSLAIKRMTGKAQRITNVLETQKIDWHEAFYIILTRALGTGVNSDAGERLARSLPYAYLRKHLDQPLQVEALLMGQAGWLETSLPDTPDYAYYHQLQREYAFLRNKFNLKPLPAGTWKFSKMRPQASPQLRIACLAALLTNGQELFPAIREASDIKQIAQLLTVRLKGFWSNHYSLTGTPSRDVNKGLGQSTIRSLIINAVIPIMLSYHNWECNEEAVEKDLEMLEAIPAENNRYIAQWTQIGIPVRNALDSQALLHLYKEYCQMHRCMNCRIGCWLVKN